MKKILPLTEKDYSNIITLSDTISSGLSLVNAEEIVLTKLLEEYQADSAIFFTRCLNSSLIDEHKSCFINLGSSYVNQYIYYYSFVDPFLKKADPGTFSIRESDLMPKKEFEKLEYYLDFLKPQGIKHILAIYLKTITSFLGMICLYRYGDSPSFSKEDLLKSQIFSRFFTLVLNQRLSEEQFSFCDMDLKLPAAKIDKWNLSEKEVQTSYYICKGLSNKEISKIQQVSLSTITTRIRNIYEKLDISNRIQLINKVLYE